MLRRREDWHKLYRENLPLKILAFTLATVSIYSIQRITNQTDEFEVPIQIVAEPGMAVLQQDARYAYITCRGSLEDLRRLDQSQLRLIVRPRTGGRTGPEQVPIGLRNVHGVPRSISVTKVRPNLLHLTLDREIEKQISVARPELLGQPALGRAEIEFSPKIVTVRGPQKLLHDLKVMQTAPMDIEGVAVSFSRELPVLTDDETGVWEVTPSTISARVNIVTERISREWPNLPVLILRAPDSKLNFEPSPSVVSVSLLGSPQSVNEFEADDIRVFIDCTAITEPGEYEVTATVNVERGSDIRSAITPPVINVTVTDMTPSPLSTNDVSVTEEHMDMPFDAQNAQDNTTE